MMHGRVIVMRSEADSAKNAASPVHVEAYDSVTTPGPVVTGVVPPIVAGCRAVNNKNSTHNVQGRSKRRVCKAVLVPRAYAAHGTQQRAPVYQPSNPADIFLAR